MAATRNVPFFNYPALFATDEAELMTIVHDVLRRGAYIMQKDLLEFEENLARYLGVKHVVGVADGTVALMMGLRAAGIGPGDEVIVPSHTFVASAASIHHVGAKPVLADCGRDHLIDPSSIAKLITAKTRAIMPVQLNGRTANMDPICALADQHGLKIVEDSAQALGSKFKGRFAGTFGVAGTCSFYPSKTLGCFGDGGAVFTNNDKVAEYLHLLRDHGRAHSGDVVEWGYNSRLDNLQAAILGFKLKHYDQAVARRRQIAARYEDQLHDLDDLLLPPAPDSDPDHFDIYQNYEVESGQRDALR
ncbi:MAG: DegT/DnrJ/EryC1/StrS family aminotransferase, partial [Magnetococcales bacterium]|nr:DegT/DnrJ/EryC1/StrS family aminotransferase [Magnetococcales bacterium]NGZ29265.1 DegT/DnrJ/EryC1/StrS family aminotransferase [Magnetococcales bacterium]